ncbi:larval cuticle protein LCP-17-like isoform X2 [Bicyclus anynana]|uniref:Larval cuticle protein LCP-17-like isoform X2 n=1 Tax=Bicyclus anynana TaxID=110368 RepID=A0ABM3LQR9_BICAN|nr:larval cuticle protein LCP-17-like isoform X2 [Bicyclus anynana]
MKFLVVLALVACAAADVPHVLSPDYESPIVKSTYEISPDGNAFQYAYETGNQISAQAAGAFINTAEGPALEVKGAYDYIAPDGTPVHTTYVANDQGYVATGSHIPSVPEAIVRSLEYIRAHAPVPERVYKP